MERDPSSIGREAGLMQIPFRMRHELGRCPEGTSYTNSRDGVPLPSSTRLPSGDQSIGMLQSPHRDDVGPPAASTRSIWLTPATTLETATLDPFGLSVASSAPACVSCRSMPDSTSLSHTSSCFVRDEMKARVFPSALTFRNLSLAALFVTRSSAPVATPVRASTGTCRTPTFSVMLANAIRPEDDTAGLRSTAVPNVNRRGAADARPVSEEMGIPRRSSRLPRGRKDDVPSRIPRSWNRRTGAESGRRIAGRRRLMRPVLSRPVRYQSKRFSSAFSSPRNRTRSPSGDQIG